MNENSKQIKFVFFNLYYENTKHTTNKMATEKLNINVDLLDIPTSEVLINTIRTCTPQQVAERINKEFLTILKTELTTGIYDEYKFTDIKIDITKYCVGYKHSEIVYICKTILDKYRSSGYKILAKVGTCGGSGSAELRIHSMELPLKNIGNSPPNYDEIFKNNPDVKEACI